MTQFTLSPEAAASAARLLDKRLVGLDQDLSNRFLLEADYPTTAQAALQSGEAVFICAAALPLKRRKEVFEEWRKNSLRSAAAACDSWGRFIGSLENEERQRILSGKVSFIEIDGMLQNFTAKESAIRQASIQSKKQLLKSAMIGAVTDGDEVPGAAFPCPRFLVILATGETALFYRRDRAKTWGECSGAAFFAVPIETPKGMIFLSESSPE